MSKQVKARYVQHKSTGKISIVSPDKAKRMVESESYAYTSARAHYSKLFKQRKKIHKEKKAARKAAKEAA